MRLCLELLPPDLKLESDYILDEEGNPVSC